MQYRSRLLLLQLAILAALVLSAVLLVDQIGPTPAYCDAGSGCMVARHAAARWLGPLPLPLVGVFAFAVLLTLTTLLSYSIGRTLLKTLTAVGGVMGLLLLLLQGLILKRFCPYCVAVDLLSVAIAFWVWVPGTLTRTPAGERPLLGSTTVVIYGIVALIAPAIWPEFRPANRVPEPLVAYQVRGRITLVEFVDLECTHCRALYPTLDEFAKQQGDKVAVVRLHVPFARHERATRAARLLQCTRNVAQSEELERRFFEAKVFTDGAIAEAAMALGMSRKDIDKCLSDPSSLRKVTEQITTFRSLGQSGLPLTYLAGERIGGAMPKAVYEAALLRVQRLPEETRARTLTFWGILLGLLVAAYFVGRSRGPLT